MLSPDLVEKMQEAGLRGGRRGAIVCAALLVVGVAAFLFGVLGDRPVRAWQAYHVNFVFWIGIGFGGVMFSAVLSLTDARWGRPMKRMAESFSCFLPVACILFGILYLGREHLFPWIHHPPAEKAAWLQIHFLFIRDGAAMVAMTAVGLAIVRRSLRIDRGPWQPGDPRILHAMTVQKALSVVYGILFAFLMSLLAFDLIMSLEPHFFSALFGAWYFMGSFYTALASLILLMAFGIRNLGLGPFVKPSHFLSIGQLLLGFCMITGDFFFTQILIIWYGNLPEETHFVLLRMREQPWQAFGWIVLVCCYVVPLGVLLSRRVKMRPVAMALLSLLILAGVWLERWLLVAPSLWRGKTVPLGILEILITAGFAGLVLLCIRWFLSRFPVLPLMDPMFLEAVASSEKGHGH